MAEELLVDYVADKKAESFPPARITIGTAIR